MIEIYIGTDRVDTFKDEDVNITLNVQNIQDISKVYADYTQSFSVPASRINNDLFKHYYNADVSGGFSASLRQSATIILNKETFREGSIELAAVNMQGNLPSSYEIVFYSAGVNLLDLFGDDQLTDLDLSAYDHDYTGANIKTGLEDGLSSRNIIYPLISPKEDWFYDSSSSSHDDYNLAYHTTNDTHGCHYYELKPAIRLSRIIDAIESKYSITFNSEFFASAEFTDLYMWCHRREGYMFEGQATGFEQAEAVDFTSATGSGFDISTDELTIPSTYDRFIWRYSATCADDYQFHWYINDVFFTAVSHSGNVTDEEIYFNSLSTGDRIQMRFLPATTNTSITSVSASGREFTDPTNVYWTATASGQTITQEVVIADQMPEQKVSDFVVGLIKMFNLSLEPTSMTEFTVETLDDWYAEGNQYDITNHTDITTRKVSKPELYRRIKLEHQLADSQQMNNFRLTNGGVGYGDLRADFTFDGGELTNQTNFELLKFEKLVDVDTSTNVDFLIGSSIDKELKPYIGAPMIFYSPNTKDISSDPIGFLDESGDTGSGTHGRVDQINFIANVNSDTITSVTRMLTFGLNIEPYHNQAFNETLYEGYWENYITNLYSVSRRVYSFRAILPLEVICKLKMNDRLVWNGYRFIINQIKVNLRTREANLELLNDVGTYLNPTEFAELLDEQGNYLTAENGDYLIVE